MTADGAFSSRIDREIFNIGLAVETISLYLLCCGLLDAGASPSKELLRSRWNASPQAFEASLKELEEKKIIRRIPSQGPDGEEFQPTSRSRWQL